MMEKYLTNRRYHDVIPRKRQMSDTQVSVGMLTIAVTFSRS